MGRVAARGHVDAAGLITIKRHHTGARQRRYALPWGSMVLPIAILAHLGLVPYTKVEESFNMQAAHDALVHGLNISAWDHHTYPGAVPRTFVGAILLAAVSAPADAVLRLLRLPRICSSLLVRAALGAAHADAHHAFAASLPTPRLYLLLTSLQFHLPFYASRTLPNSLALPLVLYALAAWSRSRYARATALLTTATVVLRCDLGCQRTTHRELVGDLLPMSLVGGGHGQ